MDAMKEALRRKMLAMHGEKHPMLEIQIGQEGHDGDEMPEKSGSDLAPSLKHGMGGMGGEQGADEGAADGMDPQHQEILAALADHGHSGREAGSLHERVADKAKEKMASIQKHKSGKY